MDTNKQPGISFDGIILINESFHRDVDIPQEVALNIDFNVNCNMPPEGIHNFNLQITTTVCGIGNEKEVYKLVTTHVGVFSYIPDQENLNAEKFMKYNAPAIMMPFIREHIHSITQKSGITPVLLAPINIVAILNEKKETA